VKLSPAISWSTNGHSDRPRAMLRSLVALGHDLGWHLAVGGVETRDRAEALPGTGCDFAQGFFYHGLLDAPQAAALMRQSAERGGEPAIQ
jgi:EAL domain-containing protein (putative c-di-GMP-specific phosphodiesterase class I)